MAYSLPFNCSVTGPSSKEGAEGCDRCGCGIWLMHFSDRGDDFLTVHPHNQESSQLSEHKHQKSVGLLKDLIADLMLLLVRRLLMVRSLFHSDISSQGEVGYKRYLLIRKCVAHRLNMAFQGHKLVYVPQWPSQPIRILVHH